jgi:hypothetical protein
MPGPDIPHYGFRSQITVAPCATAPTVGVLRRGTGCDDRGWSHLVDTFYADLGCPCHPYSRSGYRQTSLQATGEAR